jgi:hypothetical protein
VMKTTLAILETEREHPWKIMNDFIAIEDSFLFPGIKQERSGHQKDWYPYARRRLFSILTFHVVTVRSCKFQILIVNSRSPGLNDRILPGSDLLVGSGIKPVIGRNPSEISFIQTFRRPGRKGSLKYSPCTPINKVKRLLKRNQKSLRKY